MRLLALLPFRSYRPRPGSAAEGFRKNVQGAGGPVAVLASPATMNDGALADVEAASPFR